MEGITLPIRILNIEQACVFLGIGIRQLHSLVKSKKITKGKQGRSAIFDVDELIEYKKTLL